MSVLAAKALVVTALSMSPGDAVTVDGTLTTTWDGTRFDAAALVDAEAGGLRLASREGSRVRLVWSGAQGTACVAAGIASPCLVPSLESAAHARLLSVEEFRRTLEGEISIAIVPQSLPVRPPSRAPIVFAMVAAIAAILASIAAMLRRHATSPLGRVRFAARAARRAIGDDATLRALRDEIDRLVAQAESVDAARRSCERALRRIDREATRFAEERAETERLARDLETARARLSEIAAALRLVPLRVREHRDLGKRLVGPSPLESVGLELGVRESALAEAERL